MKQPVVSVIVPTYNSAEFIEACLRSIVEQTYTNIELIVVDNNSTDKTKDIARTYTKNVYNQGPERSAQRNYGAKMSKGEYLLIIDSDMELTAKVVADCVAKFQAEKVIGLVIPEESFGIGFWAQCKRLERSFYVGVDWMEAAQFFARKDFEAIGGYDEANTGTEDYDLPHRMQKHFANNSIGRIESYINHNERKISLLGTCKKKYYYAKNLGVYKDKSENKAVFSSQSSLLNRYKLYFRKPQRLFRHPVVGLGMLFMKTSEFVAGGLGYMRSLVI